MSNQKKEVSSSDIQINKTIPTLVSFAICPFVQRSVITLNIKKVPFDRVYIDLSNPPAWFTELVPTERVPALLFNNDVLFESAVINEYIDESDGQRLQQKTAWERGKERAWISLVEELIFDQYRMLLADNETDFIAEKEKFISKLIVLGNKAGHDFFSDDSFGLLDAAIAPVFTRLKLMSCIYQEVISSSSENNNLTNWIDSLVALDVVKESVVDDFETQFFAYFGDLNSYALKNEKNSQAA